MVRSYVFLQTCFTQITRIEKEGLCKTHTRRKGRQTKTAEAARRIFVTPVNLSKGYTDTGVKTSDGHTTFLHKGKTFK